MKVLAIDPGPEESALVVYDAAISLPVWWVKEPNGAALSILDDSIADEIAIEMIASYGMAVGATVFETCLWTGRFIERWLNGSGRRRPAAQMVYRRDVKSHLCGNQRAKDPNIRQALVDRYGPGKDKAIGLKASPGPLYGMKADCWSALAVAVTAAETMLQAEAA